MFKNPFSFEGRIRRLEYGLSLIAYYASAVVLQLIFAQFEDSDSYLLLFVFWIPLFWFIVAQGAKRSHDRGNSGWWQLIPFYPLFMLFADGEPHTNEYGEDPKGRGSLIDTFLTEENPAP